MSSKLSTFQASQINLNAFKQQGLLVNLISSYNEQLKSLNNTYNTFYNTLTKSHYYINDKCMLNTIENFQNKVYQIKAMNNQSDTNLQNIKVHAHFQNLTDSFLGQAKLTCFIPAIIASQEIQEACFKSEEDTGKQLVSFNNDSNVSNVIECDVSAKSALAQSIAKNCDFIFNMATSMDENITAAFDSIYNIDKNAVCAGDCTVLE
jgi:hypothetical protein